MKPSKKTILMVLATMSLAACGGNNPTPSGSSSASTLTTSETSDTSESSEATSETSETSEPPVVSTVFNAYNAAAFIAQSANKYGNQAWTPSGLLAEAKKLITLTSEDPASDTKATEIEVIDMIYLAFKDIMPEHIGARSFQANVYDLSKLKLTGIKATDPAFAGIQWMADRGILTTRTTNSLSASKSLPKSYVKTYLDRLHAYLGESEVDDFFATVNHDWLYDDNPYPHARPDGIADYDVDRDGTIGDEEDIINISDSNLIPESRINEWAKGLYDNVKDAKDFEDTYLDQTQRVKGVSAGLTAAINRYLAATTISEFIDILSYDLQNYGYCPLWGDFTSGNYSYTSGVKVVLAMATAYNFTAPTGGIAPGSAAYRESVDRFTPIFQDILGCNDEEALRWGTAYTQFKYLFSRAKPATEDNYLEPSASDPTYGPGFRMYDFLKDAGVKDPGCFLFTSKNDITAIMTLFNSEDNLEALKGLAVWQLAQHYTLCLPNEEHVMAWAYKPGYGNDVKTLSLDAQYYTYCTSAIAEHLADYYTKTEDFATETDAIIGLLGQLSDVMSARIAGEDWLSDDGKAKAQSKLDDLDYSIGGRYPGGVQTFKDLPDLKSIEEGGTLFANLGALEKYSVGKVLARLGDDWGNDTFAEYCESTNPLTANAFYAPFKNGINITLGYMAAYSDVDKMSIEDKLACYGAVVGHELSHGFDSNGVNFDNHGVENTDWFSAEDKKAYTTRVKNIIDYYDGYEVMPARPTPGKTVQTEVIADVNGLHLCMDIADEANGFDYDKFFTHYAENFGFYASQYTYATYYAADEHPVGRARVNRALSCLDEFHETYETKEGDFMYVAPEDRIVVW